MTTVSINREVLNWALNRSGLTVDDLQSKFSRIRQWISGQSQPTLRQLESFAQATSTPFGYFFLEKPPKERLPIPFFRTHDDEKVHAPSPDLLDTIHMMQQRQSWMREYLVEMGQEVIPFVKSADIKEKPPAIADRIRTTFGLGDDWAGLYSTWKEALKGLQDAMEKAGILVVVNGIVKNNTHRKLDTSEFRGFVMVDSYAPLVFVNGADAKAAQMFTLAHEIAHVFYGSSAAFDLRQMAPAENPIEKSCNLVTAEFLIPEKKLRDIWPSVKNETEPFQMIARRFKVSSIVSARRALDLRLISKDDFLQFYRAYQQDERRTAKSSEGGDFYATQNLRVGQRFASTVYRAVKEGKLLYSEAYKLTGLYGKSFENYASHLGIGGI